MSPRFPFSEGKKADQKADDYHEDKEADSESFESVEALEAAVSQRNLFLCL